MKYGYILTDGTHVVTASALKSLSVVEDDFYLVCKGKRDAFFLKKLLPLGGFRVTKVKLEKELPPPDEFYVIVKDGNLLTVRELEEMGNTKMDYLEYKTLIDNIPVLFRKMGDIKNFQEKTSLTDSFYGVNRIVIKHPDLKEIVRYTIVDNDDAIGVSAFDESLELDTLDVLFRSSEVAKSVFTKLGEGYKLLKVDLVHKG